MKPKVEVISLGGTIAMQPDGVAPGAVPVLNADNLIAAVPALHGVADIQAQSLRNLPSASLTFEDMDALAAAIRAALDNGANGVVVTQGTDTIEETAFWLDLVLDVDAPVIVTGAMRNPARAGADGPANLLGAVQVAASGPARGLGVLVVFNDEVHAARFVHKTHTSSTATFRSDPLGPVGWLAEDRVRIMLAPRRLPALEADRASAAVRVPIIKLGMGDDDTLINAALAAGVDGIVLEALGGGHVPVLLVKSLEKAAAKIPVILTSRTGQGETLSNTYGFAGSETDLLSRGLICGGRLDGCRARILLIQMLRQCITNRAEIREQFGLRGTN